MLLLQLLGADLNINPTNNTIDLTVGSVLNFSLARSMRVCFLGEVTRGWKCAKQ